MAGRSDYESSSPDLSEEVILLNDSPTHPSLKISSIPLDLPISKQSLLESSFYQHYFDIDTSQVLNRIHKTLYPKFEGSFFDNEKPDLYGPFWAATTLILAVSIAGSIGSYLTGADRWVEAGTVLISGACIVYTLIVLVPMACYCSLSSAGSSVGLIEIISMYGYSLIPVIFGSLLCAIPINEVQWIVMAVAVVYAFVPLLRNLKNEMNTLTPEQRYKIGGILAAGHLFLAISIKLYFLPSSLESDTDSFIGLNN